VQVGETAAWDRYVFWLQLHVSVDLSKLATHAGAGRRRYVLPIFGQQNEALMSLVVALTPG
jgi:hypothetical protein